MNPEFLSEVYRLNAKGKTQKQIAAITKFSLSYVCTALGRLRKQHGAKNNIQLALIYWDISYE